MSDTLQTLTAIFREVFEDLAIQLTPDTTADDVEGWDSMSHMNLIMAVENRFNIRFKQKEVVSFKNVGDMVRCVDSKISG